MSAPRIARVAAFVAALAAASLLWTSCGGTSGPARAAAGGDEDASGDMDAQIAAMRAQAQAFRASPDEALAEEAARIDRELADLEALRARAAAAPSGEARAEAERDVAQRLFDVTRRLFVLTGGGKARAPTRARLSIAHVEADARITLLELRYALDGRVLTEKAGAAAMTAAAGAPLQIVDEEVAAGAHALTLRLVHRAEDTGRVHETLREERLDLPGGGEAVLRVVVEADAAGAPAVRIDR